MFLTLAVLLTTSMFTVNTDTTVTVKPGTRLQVDNFGGSITITTWAKNAVHIEGEHSTRSMIGIEGTEGALKITTSGRRGPPSAADLNITMPKWMDAKLSGIYTDMAVDGSEAEVRAETVKGEITLRGGKGFVALQAVEGGVNVRGARGKLQLSSVNEAVKAVDIEGEINAQTVNGDVVLSNVRSALVDASTVNGDICYSGAILNNGHYRFATHNGDVTLALPDHPSASVSVSTFSGDFESAFNAKLFDTGGKRFNFTLGSGNAEIALESFQGTIKLARSDEKCDDEVKAHDNQNVELKHKQIKRERKREREDR